MSENDIERILNKVKENTRIDAVRITTNVSDERLPLIASKFGGVPYWIDIDTYPKSKGGTPLTLLAQINLADLPANDMLPREGVLQFFLLNGGWSGEWAVIFHREVDENGDSAIVSSVPTSLMPGWTKIKDENGKKKTVSNKFWGEEGFPVAGEMALEFTVEDDYVNTTEDRFKDEIVKAVGELCMDVSDGEFACLADAVEEKMYYEQNGAGHKMFGCPYFVQYDSRTEGDDVLLLQIDSETFADKKNLIMFGDTGVCRFFISREDLKNLDFSKVRYDWDCC